MKTDNRRNEVKTHKIKVNQKLLLTLFILPLIAFFQFLPRTAFAEDENKALVLLQKMNQAVNRLDYQMYFTSQNKNQESHSFEYSHLGSTKKKDISARLTYLEGPNKEIILHHGVTSYFQSNNSSFSIYSSHITEAFPDIIYTDLSKLTNIYDFIWLGKMRTANRSAEIVRVVAKNKDRYHYAIWIDTETQLPLRVDLINLDNELIQQLKVINLNINVVRKNESNLINNQPIPILLAIEEQKNVLNKWQIAWVPDGFTEISTYNVSFYHSSIATKFFTDGVFSFAVNISENVHESHPEYSLKQPNKIIRMGERMIFSTDKDNSNMIIIGDLPLITMERIAQHIVQKPIQKSQ